MGMFDHRSLGNWPGPLCLCVLVTQSCPTLCKPLDFSLYVLVTQSCPTLCNLLDFSLPGSSVHGVLQAKLLEWVAIFSSRGSSWPRDWTQVSCTTGGFLLSEPPGKPFIAPYFSLLKCLPATELLKPLHLLELESHSFPSPAFWGEAEFREALPHLREVQASVSNLTVGSPVFCFLDASLVSPLPWSPEVPNVIWKIWGLGTTAVWASPRHMQECESTGFRYSISPSKNKGQVASPQPQLCEMSLFLWSKCT